MTPGNKNKSQGLVRHGGRGAGGVPRLRGGVGVGGDGVAASPARGGGGDKRNSRLCGRRHGAGKGIAAIAVLSCFKSSLWLVVSRGVCRHVDKRAGIKLLNMCCSFVFYLHFCSFWSLEALNGFRSSMCTKHACSFGHRLSVVVSDLSRSERCSPVAPTRFVHVGREGSLNWCYDGGLGPRSC